MAVYEHTYGPYAGPLTPTWSRFLIIPRHAYRDVFKSKLFTAFFAVCFVPALIAAVLIYLNHNLEALTIFKARVGGDLIPVNSYFFRILLYVQSVLSFWLTVFVGPALVSRDLSNNALPLYLCRPFSRAEYVTGKLSVILILLSAVTWAPGLLLFGFQSYLEGAGWMAENLWIAKAVVVTSVMLIMTLALLAVTLSAWIKWRLAASAALFGVFMIPSVFGLMVAGLFRTWMGNLLDIGMLLQTVGDSLFRQPNTFGLDDWLEMPVGAAWAGLLSICAFCLFLLTRKVRAYEVVK